MSLAIARDLARGVLGRTGPHPAIGAVIGVDGEVVAGGSTDLEDGHAIRAAIVAAGSRARGATLFTTLGPRHQDRVLLADLDQVVVGCPWPGTDSHARIDAGCLDLVRGWLRARSSGLPEVTVKVATSVDGRIATHTGASQWITSASVRERGHQLRSEHDAILVGIGTVLSDDPRLTCRVAGGVGHPRPVVVDTKLRIPPDARVLHGPVRALVVCGPEAEERTLQADVIRVQLDAHGRVDIEEALRVCVDAGLVRILVEGGGQVTRSFLDAGLVDRIHQFIAGAILPGGLGWIGGPSVAALDEIARLQLERVEQIGDEGLLVWRSRHRMPDDLLRSVTWGAPGQGG